MPDLFAEDEGSLVDPEGGVRVQALVETARTVIAGNVDDIA
jgi:hypothetical protein